MKKDVPITDLARAYHQSNFWIKQFLSVMIIVFSILLISNPSILIQRLWNASAVPFILLLIAGLGGQLGVWRVALTVKKNEERDLDDNALQLAQVMGSSISTYYFGKNLDTAFLWRGKKLVIGENVRNMLSENELLAVLAHEFSHDTRKGIHNQIFLFGLTFTSVVVFLFGVMLPLWRTRVVMLACCYLILRMFYWYPECDCDSNAVKYVPIDDFTSALTKIYEGKFIAFSFEHPSPNYRIKRLETNANQ